MGRAGLRYPQEGHCTDALRHTRSGGKWEEKRLNVIDKEQASVVLSVGISRGGEREEGGGQACEQNAVQPGVDVGLRDRERGRLKRDILKWAGCRLDLRMFRKKKKKRPEISVPKNFEHRVHTSFDAQRGCFVGLPTQWQSLIENLRRPRPMVDPSRITEVELRPKKVHRTLHSSLD
ncbi:hypothetical protein PAMA_004384 [Pampus argenteus]